MENTWDVIFWVTERKANYVPSSWANSDKTQYKWPTGASRPGQPSPTDLITRCMDVKNNFSFFPAQFKKTVNSLEEAERCVQKAENGCSDLDSEAGSVVSSISSASRKNRRVVEDESTTDDEGTNGWKRPKFSLTNDNLGTILQHTNLILNDADDEFNNTLTPSENVQRAIGEDLQKSANPDNTQSPTRMNDIQPPPLTHSERYLVRIISNLKYEITDLKNSVNRLENTVMFNQRDQGHYLPSTGSREEGRTLINMLPTKSKDELLELEALVASSENYFQLLEDFLYLVGGDHYKTAIYGCLKKLVTTEVAVQYSGQGKLRGGQKKDSFGDLKVCAALMKAIRRRFPDTTDSQFKGRVGTFFCTAKDRDGGRKRRTN